MGTFYSEKILHGNPQCIEEVGNAICNEFMREGFATSMEEIVTGGVDIYLSRSGFGYTLAGLNTALKVTIIPKNGNIFVKAGIGIWGHMIIPAIIKLVVCWFFLPFFIFIIPISILLVPAIFILLVWGLLEQSKLDKKAIDIAEAELAKLQMLDMDNQFSGLNEERDFNATDVNRKAKFCTNCGSEIIEGSKFCSNCGSAL